MQAGLSKRVRRPKYRNYCNVALWALFAVKWHYLGCFAVMWSGFWSRRRFWSGWIQIYLTYCNVPLLGIIGPKMSLFGPFCCNPDPDADFWSRCRFWSGWTQIYRTYCNVQLLALICCELALFGLFWCNLGPDPDLLTIYYADFDLNLLL